MLVFVKPMVPEAFFTSTNTVACMSCDRTELVQQYTLVGTAVVKAVAVYQVLFLHCCIATGGGVEVDRFLLKSECLLDTHDKYF